MANGIVLNIDTTKSEFQNPMVQLRQGDGNYQSLDVTVTSNGEPFDLTGWTTTFMGTTAGGFKIVDTAVSNVDNLNGKFTYTPTKAWGQNQGEFKNAYFSFVKSDKTASSAAFRVNVLDAVDITAEEAGDYISIVDQTIDKLSSDVSGLVTSVNDLKSQNLSIKTSNNTWTGTNTFNTPIVGSVTGSATKLQTPRMINGTPFDGTSDITITGSGALAVGGIYPTLADLASANPNHDRTYITTDNGNWNYWNGTTWVAGGVYQSVGIAKGSVSYDNLDSQSKISQYVFFDIRKSALNRGYYQYLPFSYEIGAINSTTGSDRDNTNMLRTDFVIGDGKKWTFWNNNQDLYDCRLLSYKLDGTFNALEFDWTSSDGFKFNSDISLKYRLMLTTKNQSAASTLSGIKAVNVASDIDLAPYNPMNLSGRFDYMITVGGNRKPTFLNTDTNGLVIEITMPATNLFYYDNVQTGFQVTSPASYKNQKFVLQNNQLLVWDLDNNTISVMANNVKRPDHNVLLANNIYGLITNGHFAQYFQMQNTTGYTNTKGFGLTAVEKFKKLTSFSLGNIQGVCYVGDTLLIAQGANDDHSNTSHLLFYDENFNLLKDVTHNIGHFNTIGYNSTQDTLITGNASDTPEKPTIWLISNVSSLLNGDNIDYQDSRVKSINLFNDTTVAFNSNVGATFGETDFIAYLSYSTTATYTVGNLGAMGTIGFAKIMLGVGENDLSSQQNGYGTFVSGVSGYNGTAKILNTFSGENIGVNQDLTYYDGALWGSFGRYDARFSKIRLNSGGKYTLDKSWIMPDYNETTGAFNQKELEGSAIWKGQYYITVYKGSLTAIPINGRQSGYGNVGTKVEFDFKSSQTPHVSITPTSATTDLYIDSIDTHGFIVKSASNQGGTFNWESNI